MNRLDQEKRMKELRQRLYSRGEKFNELERHDVSDIKVDVSRDWNLPEPEVEAPVVEETESTKKQTRRYRWYILGGSMIVLLLTVAATGFYMFSGGNQISSENININIAADNTLGGGERFDAQIGVTNQNSVAIESATLIVSYPEESQSVTEPVENLFERRITVGRLEPGEAKNIPISAIVYGEEGDERQMRAQLEYRIVNSDSMFYKNAEPHNFRIASSPVTLQVRSVRQVSAGQEVEIDFLVTSNTNTEYDNLLVTASYPRGFTYTSSDPEPSYNQNVWRIDSLEPEETETITVRGTVTGLADEALRLNVGVGPSDPNNQFIAGATLTDSYTEFIIERPFIDVAIAVNDEIGSPVIIESGEPAFVEINVTNTLDESVYDMMVEVIPSGSAIANSSITSENGFYDSNQGLVRFTPDRVSDFRQFLAGESSNLRLRIQPRSLASTAGFTLTINVYGRRVNEPDAQEQLFGTSEIEVRYDSTLAIETALLHSAGPIPPVVGEETTYQVVLTAQAGTNELTGGVVRARLPEYVTWLDNYQTDGSVEFNPVTRNLVWQVGSISGAQSKDLRFGVSLLPSASQTGDRPTLVNEQTFTATDRFTGSELQAEGDVITTEIGANGVFEEGSGDVQPAD